MNQYSTSGSLLSGRIYQLLIASISFASFSETGYAQPIIPDASLDTVIQTDSDSYFFEITGGKVQGDNLFHSFESFSVPEGSSAFFSNGFDVARIFSRVTGTSPSSIDGVLETEGSADFFLLNPNGIIFGPSAEIFVGGDFVATTAERVTFADGTQFSTQLPSSQPLLTVSAPVGLGFGTKSASIVNQSFGLSVFPQQTLALLGGEVNVSGGGLSALEGHVELAGVAEGSLIDIVGTDSGTRFSYENVSQFQNVTLADDALVDVSGFFIDEEGFPVDLDDLPGGSIQIYSRKFLLDSGGFLISENDDSATGGGIFINATESIAINGEGFEGVSAVSTAAIGEGAASDIRLTAPKIAVTNGATVGSTAAFPGLGNSGDVAIDASQSLIVSGTTFDQGEGVASSSIYTFADAGNGGNVQVTTQALKIQDGGSIRTTAFDSGQGGNLNVLAASTEIIGAAELDPGLLSTLSAQSRENATGAGGDLILQTNLLSLREGGRVSTTTFGDGLGGRLQIDTSGGVIQVIGASADGFGSAITATTEGAATAGEFTINTRTLRVLDGGLVQAGSFVGSGNGGKLKIQATDLIEVSGKREGGSASFINAGSLQEATGDAGSIEVSTDRLIVKDGGQIFSTTDGEGDGGPVTVEANTIELIGISADGEERSGLYARTKGSGASGELTVTANELLTINDQARITVSTDDTSRTTDFGTVKDATIRARKLNLNNGEITAESLSGDGGNINLTVDEILLLQNQSRISASAGTDQRGGTGGNVLASAEFIVSVTSNNNDITANAFEGPGGNVTLTASRVLGFTARSGLDQNQLSANVTNDLSASSTLGTPGTVTLENFEIDPSRSLAELPADVVDGAGLIAQNLCKEGQGSEFIVTGRGGLPVAPQDALQGGDAWEDWRLDEATIRAYAQQGVRVAVASGSGGSNVDRAVSPIATPRPPQRIAEAQGWRRHGDGSVELMAAPVNIPPRVVLAQNLAQEHQALACRPMRQQLSRRQAS